jgi:glutaredoxin 3
MVTLYYYESCPFCQMVLRYIQGNKIENITLKNTMTDPSARQNLITIGGKSQVPCLVIDNKPIYESTDIINYLKEKNHD